MQWLQRLASRPVAVYWGRTEPPIAHSLSEVGSATTLVSASPGTKGDPLVLMVTEAKLRRTHPLLRNSVRPAWAHCCRGCHCGDRDGGRGCVLQRSTQPCGGDSSCNLCIARCRTDAVRHSKAFGNTKRSHRLVWSRPDDAADAMALLLRLCDDSMCVAAGGALPRM